MASSKSFGTFDALHLACAEQGGVNVFLTTDDGLLRLGRRYNHVLCIRVETRYPGIKMSDDDFERLNGLARFLRVYRAGTGDYTRDRHRWLEGATIQDIMAEVERRGHLDVG